MGATINFGNGDHSLEGDYRLSSDRGQYFIMGHNMSIPCDSLDQAGEVYKKLTGKDLFEIKQDNKYV